LIRNLIEFYITCIREGKLEGRLEGISEGELAKAHAIAKNLLLINLSPDQIVAATGLSLEELESLKG
jgi:predicted transposase YdaD